MEIIYTIVYQKEVVLTDIPNLSSTARILIKRAIEERLVHNPVGFGKPLRYSFKGHRRLRVSDYRIVYKIDNQSKTVIIVAIKHRKDVYDE